MGDRELPGLMEMFYTLIDGNDEDKRIFKNFECTLKMDTIYVYVCIHIYIAQYMLYLI